MATVPVGIIPSMWCRCQWDVAPARRSSPTHAFSHFPYLHLHHQQQHYYHYYSYYPVSVLLLLHSPTSYAFLFFPIPTYLDHAKSAFQHALKCNHQWAETTQATDPDFFPTCAQGQAPSILWLGCSDSRAPETTLLGLKPGDVFTHRNIANILSPTDLSLLSVVEFSVFHLKVKHIVVCGHTSCGGVAGAMANGKLGGPLDI
ncbi:hypothetical protein D0867_05694, partial [Hortaea werneckii]